VLLDFLNVQKIRNLPAALTQLWIDPFVTILGSSVTHPHAVSIPECILTYLLLSR
jgi:hypothetical protein